VDSVFDIVVALGGLAGSVAGVLIWRARKPMVLPALCCAPAEPEAAPAPGFSLKAGLAKLLALLNYLGTRREWRYLTPWVMVLGPASDAKQAMLTAAGRHRQTVPARSAELKAEGAAWHFFDQGVLIEPTGALAEANSVGADAKPWAAMLRQIESLRPERALDGLLLTVPARVLLHGAAAQRQALAETAYRQLCDIQQRYEFVLPVYVLLTDCDAVDGFGPFWQAQPAARRREMFGWSAPAQTADAAAAQWADSSFDALGEQLKTLQLDAAARREPIDEVDHFFLFSRHFQALREPLRHWLTTVFQASAWHAGFLFRGIYFSGAVADPAQAQGQPPETAFVEQLITQKVLAEHNLARPTRQGIWSRNRTIRALQVAGIGAFCALALALATAASNLNRQVDALVSSLKLLQEFKVGAEAGAEGDAACASRERVYELLTQVARIDSKAVYWAIPASWVDARASRRSARLVADAAFQRVILPALACQLEAKARALLAYQPAPESGDQRGADAYAQSSQSLFGFLQSLQKLERNLANFRQLAAYAPNSEQAVLMRSFAELAEYAYGSALPAAVLQQKGMLAAALTEVRYTTGLQLPAGMQQRFADQVAPMASRLRADFEREVGAGGALLTQLNQDREPLLAATRHFTRWLGWTRASWLGSSAQANPCETLRAELSKQVLPLVEQYGYPAALAQVSAPFGAAQCYQPSMRTLTGLRLAPYGMLFTGAGATLALNPKLQPELDGLTQLAGLDFMQLANVQPFACLGGDSGWRAADIGQSANYLREYADFARKRGLPAAGAAAERPLYDRLARHQLERALNNAMREAQAANPARQPLQQVSLQASALADAQLARESASFGQSLEALLNVLAQYSQNGFDASRARVTQCVRDYAADNLAHVDALVGVSRLYDPSAGGASDAGFFNLGTTPVALDYLARQVARGQVLAGYAAPFVTFLQNTDAINDAQRENAQTAPYWNNTIGELNRYVQFKESAGQVAQLHNLFLKQFAELGPANCGKTLAAYQSPAYGNDLFSQRRRELEEQAQWRCNDGHKAQAYEAWREWSGRFNRELAGRYPFAKAAARDAAPAVVKTFFADYAAQAPALRQALAGLPGARWEAARRFVDQLDAAAAFFAANLTAGEQSEPVKLALQFRAQPAASPGSEQVVAWNLSVGAKSVGYPNRPNLIDWSYGQPLVLDLLWADRSLWRAAPDPKQADLQIDGATASFAAAGEWALLRLIESHRAKGGAGGNGLDPGRVLLEFNVPLVAADNAPGKSGAARLYLALNLSGKDPKTQAPLALTAPPAFPRYAPQSKE